MGGIAATTLKFSNNAGKKKWLTFAFSCKKVTNFAFIPKKIQRLQKEVELYYATY